jgi:hypothetical protein
MTMPLYRLPVTWMVLTDTIMLTMWWIGTYLSSFKYWIQQRSSLGPKRMFMRRPPNGKPPDPTPWHAFIQEFMEREEVLGKKRTFIERLFCTPVSTKRKRYMMLALQAAMLLA